MLRSIAVAHLNPWSLYGRYDIFGSGGAKQRAEELQVPFLGEVPINMRIRELGDAGQVESSFDDERAAACLQPIVSNLVQQLSQNTAAAPQMPRPRPI